MNGPKLLAQAQNFLGTVQRPQELLKFGDVSQGGISTFLNLILKLLLVGGGIYALFNLVLAGYSFLSAGDNPKGVENAWAKIYQTAMGLVFMAGAFVLAIIFSELIFGKWDFIINPQLPTV